MGFLDKKWEETARLLREQLEPLLASGETLVGAVHANEPKTFSAKFYAIGITDQRLVVLPVNRKMQPAGDPPVSITKADITASSVWGWRGTATEWLSMSADQQVRVETHTAKYKWMIVGGNLVENSLAGDDHLRGLDALIDFVLSARQ